MMVTATKQVQEALGGDHFPKLTSPSLRLEKFVRLEHANKKNEIDAVVNCHNTHRQTADQRRFNDIPGAAVLVMQLQYRLIVNQAGGVLENAGLCLHRHFGFPYIPGSAVKGAARHAAWCNWNDDPNQEQALRIALTFGFPTGDPGLDESLRKAFSKLFDKNNGTFRTFAGTVSFLPAWPTRKTRLVTDIVNCHHPKYYDGKQERATDDENPNPQFFPAVEQGASFEFVLLPVRGRTDAVKAAYGFDPLDFAMKALQDACEIHGLGAKTAAGYGWFEKYIAPDPSEESYRKFSQLDDTTLSAKVMELAEMHDDEKLGFLRALLERDFVYAQIQRGKRKNKQKKELVQKTAADLGVQLP